MIPAEEPTTASTANILQSFDRLSFSLRWLLPDRRSALICSFCLERVSVSARLSEPARRSTPARFTRFPIAIALTFEQIPISTCQTSTDGQACAPLNPAEFRYPKALSKHVRLIVKGIIKVLELKNSPDAKFALH